MGWATEGSEFESRYGQQFSILHVIQTGSGVHPTSYPLESVGKAAGAWSWLLTSGLWENVDQYFHPIRLHCLVLN
jgi:hypothetical protein